MGSSQVANQMRPKSGYRSQFDLELKASSEWMDRCQVGFGEVKCGR
jgi:hypothetical protein